MKEITRIIWKNFNFVETNFGEIYFKSSFVKLKWHASSFVTKTTNDHTQHSKTKQFNIFVKFYIFSALFLAF